MGYNTDFSGSISIEPKITDDLREYINKIWKYWERF